MTIPNRGSLHFRKALGRRLVLSFLAGALALSAAQTTVWGEVSADEQALWKLEHDYWR